MKKQISVALLLSSWLLSVASAQLDFLTSPDQALSLDGKAVNGTGSNSVPVVLGGVSTTRVLNGIVTAALPPVSTGIEIFGGGLGVAQGPGDAATYTIDWGSGADMNLDLTSFGQSFFFAHSANDGTPGTEISITVWNEATSFVSPVTTLTHLNFDSDPGDEYTILFSSFPSGVDFTDVDRISFRIKAPASADLEFSSFRVNPPASAPEPGGLMLTGLTGMFALLRRSRHHRHR